MNFWNFVIFKPTGQSHTFNRSFYPGMPLQHWSFNKHCFIELCRSSKWRYISPYDILKITKVNITTDLNRKGCKYFKVTSLWWQIQVFENSNFYFKSQISSLTTNIVSYFFKKNNGLTLFFQKCLPNSQDWITIVVSCSFKKIGVLCKKGISSVCNSIMQVLYLKTLSCFCMYKKCFMHTSHLSS